MAVDFAVLIVCKPSTGLTFVIGQIHVDAFVGVAMTVGRALRVVRPARRRLTFTRGAPDELARVIDTF